MKRTVAILLLSLTFLTFCATAQDVDITEYSQNAALHDTTSAQWSTADFRIANYPSVSETYQIPAYSLYGEHWNIQHLRSRVLNIPFSDDRIMLLLVQQGNNSFTPPCVFDEISLAYGLTKKGDFHPGIDLKVEPQTLVKSCFDGVVRMAKYYGDYGYVVVIRHYNGLETVYAHLDKFCVKPGQIVQAGSVIGQTGMSGNTKSYLLHFETRFLNEYFNPEMMIDFDNDAVIKNTLVLMPADFRITALDEVKKPDDATTHTTGKTVTSTTSVNAQPSSHSTPVRNSDPQYHIVQKGETLYRIALTYGTTIDNILKINNLQDAGKINEGQRLRIR